MTGLRLACLALMLAACCQGIAAGADTRPADVSMIQLIAGGREYDGAPVRVIGFLRLEFEGDALYLHREDARKRIPKNAVSVSLTEQQRAAAAKLNNTYVTVEGTFSASEKGHFQMFSGSLHKVGRLTSYQILAPKKMDPLKAPAW